MDTYSVNLPRQNHWNDEHDIWIEKSYKSGSAFQNNYDEDDIYGIIDNGSSIDNLPILISGETESIVD